MGEVKSINNWSKYLIGLMNLRRYIYSIIRFFSTKLHDFKIGAIIKAIL